MRDYKELIRYAKETTNCVIVASRDEMKKLKEMYDKKFTLEENRLQVADLVQNRGKLNGVKLAWGEWDRHPNQDGTNFWERK